MKKTACWRSVNLNRIMEKIDYSYPFRAGAFIRKEQHPLLSLAESISQHIHLLLVTHFNENRYEREFGNAIWDNEFTNINNNNPVREHIRLSVLKSIASFEPRIEQVRADINIWQEELFTTETRRLNERVDIYIHAVICRTKEPFLHHEHFYIAPLAQE